MAQICWLSSIMRISSILTRVVDSAYSGIFGLHYTAAARRRQLARFTISLRDVYSLRGRFVKNTTIHYVERPESRAGWASQAFIGTTTLRKAHRFLIRR